MNKLVYSVYIIMPLILLWHSKFYGKGKFNDEFLSLEQTKALQGFLALCIMLHHCGQKTSASLRNAMTCDGILSTYSGITRNILSASRIASSMRLWSPLFRSFSCFAVPHVNTRCSEQNTADTLIFFLGLAFIYRFLTAIPPVVIYHRSGEIPLHYNRSLSHFSR